MHDPLPIDEIDRLLGADPDATAHGAVGYYEPRLPGAAADAAFDLLIERYRARWAEYWGEVGDWVRVLEADGVVTLDRRLGIVCDPVTGAPLRTLPDGADR